MKTSRAVTRAFTLIELMVTIAIAAVLLMVVIPSLTTFQRNAELTSITNNLIAALNVARGEAMKRNGFTFVEPLGAGGNWNGGFRVYVDQNLNMTFDEATDISILKTEAVSPYITITGTDTATGATAYLMFDAQGYSKTKARGWPAATLALTIARNDVTGSELLRQTRKVKIANTGRVVSCKPESATDPNC